MQLKTLIRYPIDVRRARRLLADRSPPPDLRGRPIALDLKTPQLLFDCGRHLASLAYHARSAGSPLYLRCSLLTLSAVARKFHGREMLAQPYVGWIPSGKPLPEHALVLCDYEPAPSSRDYVRMLIGRDIDRRIPVMPYPMHPWTLYGLGQVCLAKLRQEASRSAIFFAGNQKRSYGDGKLQRNFGVLSRLEVLQTLAGAYPSRVHPSLSSVSASSPAERPIVVADSRAQPIAPSDWLATLAGTAFFLCCPGSSQPTCHHLVEAMSVGTIPMLEYADRVTPELVDGENAICFRGRRGLVQAIQRVDRLAPDQIARLRRNVASFYDRHLCGTRFMTRLRDGDFDLSAGSICMPFHERNFYASGRIIAA